MKRFAISELFHTVQGEGINAGRAAVFVRMSGCNVWNGRHSGRGDPACAAWCDVPALEDQTPGVAGRTSFASQAGPGGGTYSAQALCDAIHAAGHGPGLVVFTGGEPTLQMTEDLVHLLRINDLEVAIETNGTRLAPENANFICVSPKAGFPIVQLWGSELKLIHPQPGLDPAEFEGRDDLYFDRYWLSPLEPLAGPDHDATWRANMDACVAYVMGQPARPWAVSTQQHKLLRIA